MLVPQRLAAVVCAGIATVSCSHWTGAATPDASRSELTAWASRLPVGQEARLERLLIRRLARTDDDSSSLWFALCDAYGRSGRYAKARDACIAGDAARVDDPTDGARRSVEFWDTLSGEPAIAVSGEIDAPLTQSWNGMALVEGRVGQEQVEWGVDTGAEVSVLRLGEARRLKVRMIGRPVQVSGATSAPAQGGLGMIDRVEIGGSVIEHLPVLVVPDEAMRVGDRFVPAILGMPVFYAFGAVEFSRNGARLSTSPDPVKDTAGRLYWSDAGVALEIGLPMGPVRMHLDTGANTTEFHLRTTSRLDAATRLTLTSRTVGAADVTGSRGQSVLVAPRLPAMVGAARCDLSGAWFGEDAAGEEGRAGFDLVRSCRSLALDFRRMRVWAS